jgi:predicted nucleotidyltransferase
VKNRAAAVAGLKAVILFGSAARGDEDVHSDRDVCAIVDDLPDRDVHSIKRRVAAIYHTDPRSVSAYRQSTVSQMAETGSLFLWHLKREGRILYDRGGAARRMLSNLKEYRRHSEDLLRFQEVFDDTAREFAARPELDLFDLHALFLVTRNVCMLLTVKAGDPHFGRASVYAGAVQHYGRLPITARLFAELSNAHLVYLRGADAKVTLPSRVAARRTLQNVSSLLRFAWRRLE